MRDFLLYQRKEFPFDYETYNQFKENIVDFWDSAKGLAPELSRLALQLFGICINSASVERLWSTMGFLHTKCQNRLPSKKVLAMSQLRSDILSKRKRNEAEKAEQQYKRIHIAAPIQPYNNKTQEDRVQENRAQEDRIQEDRAQKELTEYFSHTMNNSEESNVSGSDNLQTHLDETSKADEDMIDDSDTSHKEDWSFMIESWVSTVNDEELVNNEITNDEELEFELGGRIIHPADDPSAKWSLLELFNDSLEAPVSFKL